MSVFGGLIMTNKGRNLQAKAQTGVQLNFTKVKIGDGSLGGQSILELNGLISPKKELSILGLESQPQGRAKLKSYLSNADIVTGFYWRELGVFAQDPDEGEILYCYGNAGANAEFIPAGGGADVLEKYINIVTIVGNASNVSATLSSEVYATQVDLDNHINNPSAHGVDTKASQEDLNNHISNSDNPHYVTAEQVGAETPAGAQAKVDAHADRTDNPHNVNKAQVGLGNVLDKEQVNAIAAGSTSDPNTTQEPYILTNHANSPGGGVYWHIHTYFYSSKTGNRAQIAIQYNGTGDNMYIRHCYSSVWTSWMKIWRQEDADAHKADNAAHNATSAATANRIILRDASGRAKVAAPAASDDIARQDTVDAHANRSDNPHGVTPAQLGASNILAQIKTVDGAGSGLDADTVDGKHASEFLQQISQIFVTGTYTGDDTVSRFISLGFTPSAVILFTVKGSVHYYNNVNSGGLALNGYPVLKDGNPSYKVLEITTNGFNVFKDTSIITNSSPTSINPFRYIAFIATCKTGDRKWYKKVIRN